MAKAKAQMVEKTRQVTEYYEVREGVVLELNDREAAFLTALLGGRVTGTGPGRDESTDIWTALKDAGYGRDRNQLTRTLALHMEGSVDING